MEHRLLVASVINVAYSRLPKTKAVTAILEHHGYELQQVVDEAWFGWPSKMLGFIDIVRDLVASQDYTHLMFIDGADVVVLGGPDEVMERYFAFNHPWVYSAEPFIWSPDSFQPQDYPTPQCVYRYLNGGASIGEVGHILDCFNKWTDNGKRQPFSLPHGDQDWMAARFIEDYPSAIMLDHDCKLFQCMCGSEVGPEPNVTVMPGRVHNNVTGTDPLIVHYNGGTDITEPARRILWQHLT